MTRMLEVYRCDRCGNVIEIHHEADGTLKCCDEDMILLEEKTAIKSTGGHAPKLKETEGIYGVTVGSTLHPLLENLYIEWVQMVTGKQILIQFLKPGDEPVAVFKTSDNVLYTREYCGLHGLWKSYWN